ncbi:unnamed protein product [Kuraishia capsulata CBS 1993]|uniref:2'-phosphotransferase n=1 Tax=Kuraishia capsulata CBS 1993 TaxID=1382522 RepID=W6MU62_9ASCO|nr:uncharacterized protein KUCA_T00004882001 [Kuraishia capsulata CBS 1993]CDK28897.1 unnamed protein product [Kuraishia capsulata CBS 1993]
MSDKRNTLISKKMSRLLRHQAEAEGLTIDAAGYVPLNELLAHPLLRSFKTTEEDVRRVIAADAKQRYGLKEDNGVVTVCAFQGHSMASVGEVGLEVVAPADWPSILIHGTYRDKFKMIQDSGLSRMKRNHIHLASGIPQFLLEKWQGEERLEEVASGLRKSCNCLIILDIDKMKMLPGIVLYRSENGVYLTPGVDGRIPAECFKKVTDQRGISL